MPNQVKIGVESSTFDNFALDCFRNCETYYFWRILKGIIKPGAKKTAADFGSCIHSALEHYYKKGMTDQSIQEAMQLFTGEFNKFQDPADDKRTLGRGLEILERYFLKYRYEPFNVIDTEIGGAVELGGYLYTSRIDLLVEWQSPKGIYGFDHKTSSSLGRLIPKPNNQVTGYIMTLAETYVDLLGYMINGIGVYKEDTEIDKNAPKVPSSKTGKLIYATKEKATLVRLPTMRTKKEIEAWKRETLHLIHQIEECQEKDVWPKKDHFCSAYASRCMYLDLCQAQDRDIIIPLLEGGIYQKVDWVPYTGRGEEEGGEDGNV